MPPDAWELHDVQLVSTKYNGSAVNDEILTYAAFPVPAGKLWTVTAFGYMPSVAETQVIAISKIGRTGQEFALLNPISLALNPALATFIEQGMLYCLYPGEYLVVRRAGHTIPSSMTSWMQYIETDLPLYEYIEPQIKKSIYRASSQFARRLGGGRPAAGIAPPIVPPGSGGGRER